MLITANDEEERISLFTHARVTTLKEEAKEYPGFLGQLDGYRQHLLASETVVIFEDAESFFDKMRLEDAFLVNTSEEDKLKLFAIADKVLANKPKPVVAATSIVNAMASFPKSSGRTKSIIIEDLKAMNIINIDDLKKMSLKDIMKGFKSRNTARKEHHQKTPYVDFDNNAEVTKDFRNWRSKVTNPAAFVDNVTSDFAVDLKTILVDHGILLPFTKANITSNCLIEDIVDVKDLMEKGTISDGHITTMLQESALIQYSWTNKLEFYAKIGFDLTKFNDKLKFESEFTKLSTDQQTQLRRFGVGTEDPVKDWNECADKNIFTKHGDHPLTPREFDLFELALGKTLQQTHQPEIVGTTAPIPQFSDALKNIADIAEGSSGQCKSLLGLVAAGGRSKVKKFSVTAAFLDKMIIKMKENYSGNIPWVVAKVMSDLNLYLLCIISPLLNKVALNTLKFNLKEDADPSQKPDCISSVEKTLTKSDVLKCLREILRDDFSDEEIKSTFLARRADIMVAHLTAGLPIGNIWFQSFQPDLLQWLQNLVQTSINCIGQVAPINSRHAFNYVQSVLLFTSNTVKSSNISSVASSTTFTVVELSQRFNIANMILGTKTTAEDIAADIKFEQAMKRSKRQREDDEDEGPTPTKPPNKRPKKDAVKDKKDKNKNSAKNKQFQDTINAAKDKMMKAGVDFNKVFKPPSYAGETKKPCYIGILSNALSLKCPRPTHPYHCCDFNKIPDEMKTVEGIIAASKRVKEGGNWY